MTTIRNPGEGVLGLICGLAPTVRQRRLMLMLQAFVDDSGSHGGPGAFMLAGYLAPAENWLRFSDDWDEVCQRDPPTPNFKASTAFHLGGIYWRHLPFDDAAKARDLRFAELAAVVAAHAARSISVLVTWDDYNAIVKGNVDAAHDHPYFFLFWELILGVVKDHLARGESGKIDFHFDYQSAIGDLAQSWHRDMVKAIPPEAAQVISNPPVLRHDDVLLPLKAADFLVWHMRKRADERLSGSTPIQLSAGKTLDTIKGVHILLNREKLAYLVRVMKETNDLFGGAPL